MNTADLSLIMFASFVVGCSHTPPAQSSQSQTATRDAVPTSKGPGDEGTTSGDSAGRSRPKGSLPPQLIQQVVRDNLGALRTCYEEGLRRNSNLTGKISTKFVIELDGHVSSAVELHAAAAPGPQDNETAKPTLEPRFPDSAVVDCVLSKFASITFPQPQGGIVTVIYPILFAPAPEEKGAEEPATAAETRSGTAKKGGDPHGGSFTLAEATKDLKGTGAIVAKIETSKGTLQCKLFADKAPVTVANFIGLATGRRAWKAPKSDGWVTRPAYDGTTFHRVIKSFMIQGGDPKGNGSGEPGYVFKDEIWQGAKHDRAGLLCTANRGPDTNGAQFFITDAAAPHLDGGYTIFGECAPVSVVHEIASVPVVGERPADAVTIKSVTISRQRVDELR
jgi:peptidyl-prolyl cis-trans isomerase A (cyclophilin A)